jgi:transposase
MMGERRMMQEALFYGFSLERRVPDNHLLRKIGRFVDLSEVRAHLGPYYSDVGRPSMDPELMIRRLIVGYCFGIRSEPRLCEEVHLNLAYRCFCRLGLDADVPDHSTCPSSDDLRHIAGFQKGGSGSSVTEIMRHAVDAASDGLRLSGV